MLCLLEVRNVRNGLQDWSHFWILFISSFFLPCQCQHEQQVTWDFGFPTLKGYSEAFKEGSTSVVEKQGGNLLARDIKYWVYPSLTGMEAMAPAQKRVSIQYNECIRSHTVGKTSKRSRCPQCTFRFVSLCQEGVHWLHLFICLCSVSSYSQCLSFDQKEKWWPVGKGTREWSEADQDIFINHVAALQFMLLCRGFIAARAPCVFPYILFSPPWSLISGKGVLGFYWNILSAPRMLSDMGVE